MSPDPYDRRSRLPSSFGGSGESRRGCSIPPRLLMGLLLVVFAVGGYYINTRRESNPVTGEVQRVAMTPQQEVAMGLQAAPEMEAQFGGSHPDPQANAVVDRIGAKLVQANQRGRWAEAFAKYRFDFHLLRDADTVNAFALPGGQVFFTYGLYKHLKTEDEIAGVLGHEIGHVIGRHSAEQIEKSKMWAGISQGVGVASSDGGMTGSQVANLIYTLKTTSYGRADENQADELGVKAMVNAGYNPEALKQVMAILKQVGGGGGGPEFLKTHPDPGNRIEHIQQVIEEVRRNGTGIDGPPAERAEGNR
jgi:predicted Zn-dependent protease